VRLLWLTVFRGERVADIFGPLQRAVARQAEVDFVFRQRPATRDVAGMEAVPPVVDPDQARTYDAIFTDAPFAYLTERWSEFTRPRAALVEDLHGSRVAHYLSACWGRLRVKRLYTRYRMAFWRMHGEGLGSGRQKKVRWLPHCVDPAMFECCVAWDEKTVGALLTGARSEFVYPLRHAVFLALTGQPYYAYIDRPRDYSDDLEPRRENFYRRLSEAYLAFHDVSMYEYSTYKGFEIPMAGTSLCMQPLAEWSDLGLQPGEHYLPLYPGDDIRRRVKRALEDKAALRAMADAAQAVIQERHTADVRAGELLRDLETML